MKTAREQLYDETVALLDKSADDTSLGVMRKIMARYRVQTKPGVDIPAGTTARDALGDRLLDIWRAGVADDATRARIGTTIDEFRMQLKQAGNGAGDKPAAPRPPRPAPAPVNTARPPTAADPPARAAAATKAPTSNPGMSSARPLAAAAPAAPALALRPNGARPVPPTVQIGVGDPPTRAQRGPEPVAGGPRTRKKARGECPKCKSKGVVLARSYSGDEYYSCIYCGWQAYKAVEEDDPNASLAARLLGQTVGSE